MSATDKLANVRIRLTPEEIDEVIEDFDSLTLRKKKAFAGFIANKELTTSQQKALIGQDPAWAIKNLGDISIPVQNFILEKLPRFRVALYTASGNLSAVSSKVALAMLASRKTTPKMRGAILNLVPTQTLRHKIIEKNPISLRYAEGKVMVSPRIAAWLNEEHPSLAKFVKSVKGTNAKDRLATLKDLKVNKRIAVSDEQAETPTSKIKPKPVAKRDEENVAKPIPKPKPKPKTAVEPKTVVKPKPKLKPAASVEPKEIELDEDVIKAKPKRATAKPKVTPKEIVIDENDTKPKKVAPKIKPLPRAPEKVEEDDDNDEAGVKQDNVKALAEILEDEIPEFDAEAFIKHSEKIFAGKPNPLNKKFIEVVGDANTIKEAKANGITPFDILIAAVEDIDEFLPAEVIARKKAAQALLEAEGEAEPEVEVEDSDADAEVEVEDSDADTEVEDDELPDNGDEVAEILVATDAFEPDEIVDNLKTALEGKKSNLDGKIAELIDDADLMVKAKKAKVPTLYLLLELIQESDKVQWNTEQAKLANKARMFVESVSNTDSESDVNEDDNIEVEVKKPKSKPESEPKPKPKSKVKDEQEVEGVEEDQPSEEYKPRRRGRVIDLDELEVDNDVSDWQHNDMFSNSRAKKRATIDPADERKFVNMVKGALRNLVKREDFKATYPKEIQRDALMDVITEKLEQLTDKSEAQDFKNLPGAIQDSIFSLAIPVDKIILSN